MTSPFNQINRLRRHGLTWEALGTEIAHAQQSRKRIVARNTLRSVHNNPHYRPGKSLIRAISQVHDTYFPSPFPKGTNALLNTCRQLMNDEEESAEALQNLLNIEKHVEEQLHISKHPKLVACRLHWVLGNINQFKMRRARISGAPQPEVLVHQQAAIENYQCAFNYINHDSLETEKYKLQHNLFVSYVNAVRETSRNQNENLIEQLSTLPYLKVAEELLNLEPFQWEAARNALLYASITKNRRAVANFFERLLKANKLFADLNYKPLYADPILEDASLKWAIKNILTPNFTQTVIDKLERERHL